MPRCSRPVGGSIVNNASVLGKRSLFPDFSLYNASKFAVIGFTKTAALEYATRGVRVNAVCSAIIETDFTAARTEMNKGAIICSSYIRIVVLAALRRSETLCSGYARTAPASSQGSHCLLTADLRFSPVLPFVEPLPGLAGCSLIPEFCSGMLSSSKLCFPMCRDAQPAPDQQAGALYHTTRSTTVSDSHLSTLPS